MSLRIFQLLDLKKGFSLPLWVAVCAKAAVKKLLDLPFENYESIQIPNQINAPKLKVHSAGFIKNYDSALAITFVNSGLVLDLTNNLEIWTIASFEKVQDNDNSKNELIELVPGYGVGVEKETSKIFISSFAQQVLNTNLIEMIPKDFKLRLEIVFPNGKFLAERTSNKSFGIVDGLSIIGTSAETHISASPDQLKSAKDQLNNCISEGSTETITFAIGENGLHLAQTYKIPFPIIKVGNWIGPLLVYAAEKNVKRILLFGYHGKLIKLAGSIFHTHNHLADARIEILVCLAIREKLPLEVINSFINSKTIDEAIRIIEDFSIDKAKKLLFSIANHIEIRSKEYIQKYISSDIKVGAVLFDRERKIKSIGKNSQIMFSNIFTFKS